MAAGGALIGALRVTLGLDSAAFEAGMAQAKTQTTAFQKHFTSFGQTMIKVGAVASAAITAPFVALIKESIPAATESAQAAAQVNAALASMGPVAGRTAQQLSDFAGHLQDISNFDDDDILKSVTANLLTFGNVAGEQFDRATQAAVNLSARLGQDLQSSAIQVGKALNDPVKGITALRRVGIQFTESQKDQIAAMVEAGNTAGAQKIILAELEKEFGGAAKAQRDATPTAASQQAWRTFQENVGAIAIKVLPPLTNALSGLLNAFNKLSPEAQTFAIGGVAVAAALGPITAGIGGIIALGAPTLAALSAMGAGMAGLAVSETTATVAGYGLGTALAALLVPALPFIAAGAGLVAIGVAIYNHWNEIAPVLQAVGTALSNTFGPPIRIVLDALNATMTDLWNGPFGELLRGAFATLKSNFDTAITIFKQFVQITAPIRQDIIDLGGAFLEWLGPKLLAIFNTIGNGIGTSFKIVGDVINIVSSLLQGHWGDAWKYAQKAVDDAVTGVLTNIRTLAPGAITAFSNLYAGAKTWVQDKLGAVFTWLDGKLKDAGKWFFDLYDKVVGHSYVPDMVDGVAEQIARLDGVMVQPIAAATSKSAQSFKDLQDEVNGLLDRLFPDQAELRSKLDDLAVIDKAIAAHIGDPQVWAAARLKVLQEIDALTAAANAKILQEAGVDPINGDLPAPPPVTVFDPFDKAAKDSADTQKQTTAEIIQSYAEMARSVTDSLRGLIGAFKSGNVLDILDEIANVAGQIAAAFGDGSGGSNGGGGLGGLFKAIGGLFGGKREGGGPVGAGRAYLVGERGPELFMPSTGGTIIPNGALRNGSGMASVRVVVAANDYFDAHVTGIAGNVSADAVDRYGRAQARYAARSLGNNGR